MADGAVAADGERNARVGVQDRPVLDVGARTDGDELVIAADNRVEPYACLRLQYNCADYRGVGGNVVVAATLHTMLGKGELHSVSEVGFKMAGADLLPAASAPLTCWVPPVRILQHADKSAR